MSQTLGDAATAVLNAADPQDKIELTGRCAAAWRAGVLAPGRGAPPERPARPALPLLKPPRDMPRRRAGGSPAGRAALLHAIAHIELNAIDLAWDMVARFGGPHLPREFHDDWVAVAAEEAKHFGLLAARLEDIGLSYGDLPAHDGMWDSARATAHDFLARLAIVPLVLEARGLDVTPAMIERMTRCGDAASAAVLETILADEVGHVAAGRRWFVWACAERGLPPAPAYRDLVRRHWQGGLKPPFNHAARDAAGLSRDYYSVLA